MQEKKLSRREREKRWQRREMLSAARDLFSTKGYHKVSMREVAQKSEFAIGTLYKFFKNKEDLYRFLIFEQAGRFHEALTKAIEAADDEIEKLRDYIRANSEVFRVDAAMIRLYFAETQGAGFNIRAGLDSEIREQHSDFLQKLAMVFESGIKKKIFKKIADPYYLAVSLESITNAFLFLWLEAPELHPYPEDPDLILNIILKGLSEPYT